MKNLQVSYPNKNSVQSNVIILEGEFNKLEAMHFKIDLIDFIDQSKIDCIVDIQNVKVMDLTALNALIIAQKEMSNRGKKFFIKTGLNNPIFELLHLTKFDRHLNLKIAS